MGFWCCFACRCCPIEATARPSKRPWAVGIVIAGITSFAVLSLYAYREPWSPDFGVQPLPAAVIGSVQGPAANGAKLIHSKGCLYCHNVGGYGGHRGPELSSIGSELTRDDLIIRINNGGYNMPAFAGLVTAEQLSDLVDFLLTRQSRFWFQVGNE